MNERKRGRPPTWTDDEHSTLWELWNKGLSAAYIANVMGKSRSAILGRIHRTRSSNVGR